MSSDSIEDKLRTAECTSEMIDQTRGWATDRVGKSYGSGCLPKMLQKYLVKVS